MKSDKGVWLAVGLLPIVVVALVATADVHKWNGTVNSSNWNLNANWQDGLGTFQKPVSGDSVIIDDTTPQSTASYNEGNQDYTMVDILLGDGMTLQLTGANRLNLSDRMTVEGDAIISGTGTLTGTTTGTLFIDGGSTGASLTKTGTGDVTIGPRAPAP